MDNQDAVDPLIVVALIDRCAVLVAPTSRISVTEQQALAILERSFELTGNRQYVVLVDMGLIDSITPEARKALMSARHVRGAAMLGSTPMDRMLSAPYENAIYPSQYFDDHDTAMTWLSLVHTRYARTPSSTP